jgi:Xaa-Pro aminopeptidase
MVQMLKWIGDTATKRRVTELDVVAELERIRAHDPRHRGPSFDTIAGAGPNGAIVHYRPVPASNRVLEAGSLLLLDSGAQYLDGTTDITRTVAIGQPSAEMKRHYTLVLKAHIAIADARFPKGATGGQLDPLARQHLWRDGLDYDHGTGHGVGAYLGVHEGPQRIAVGDGTKLELGMIISNEPGLYLTDRYGIRTENLVLVREAAGVEDFLEFETITLAPYDRSLIERELLDAREIAWLNAYHARVRDTLSPELSDENAAWLREATAAI